MSSLDDRIILIEKAAALGCVWDSQALEMLTIIRELKAERDAALDLILQYGGIDGGHHKQWVLDQIVRSLTKDGYGKWVTEFEDGEDGPKTYSWDEGIAP